MASSDTQDPSYGLTARLPAVPFAQARERVTAALKDQGFGVLTEIDVKSTLKAKLDKDFRPYVILGACNPQLAHQALQADLGIGLLLPCNVCIWEEDGGSVVSIAGPDAMFEVVGNPALQPVVDEAGRRLSAALEAIRQAR